MNDLAADLKRELSDPTLVCESLGLIEGSERQANGLTVRCPAHGGHSLSVTRGPDGTIRAHCFRGCGLDGDVFSLIAAVNGMDCAKDFRDVLKLASELAGRTGAGPSRPYLRLLPRPLASTARVSAPSPAIDRKALTEVVDLLADLCPLTSARDVSAYVAGRHVHADAIALGTIGLPVRAAQPSIVAKLVEQFGRAQLEAMRLITGDYFKDPDHRLGLVWRDRTGRVVQFQRRVISGERPDKYRVVEGAPFDGLFGAELFDEATAFVGADAPVVVTEGALDCMARRKLARLTGERVVVLGAPSASHAPPQWSEFFAGRHILVAFDNDLAGDRGAKELIKSCCARAAKVERERPIFEGATDWCQILDRYMKWRAQA